jgi:CheY-like chemotaxis protein
MDLRMPGMTGIEATQAIRQIDDLEHVVIIATSASVFDRDRQQSLLAGCDAFVPKPIQVTQLLDLLAATLNLTWRYTAVGQDPAPTDAAEGAELVPPPEQELASLYELASIGDILGLQARAAQLAQQDAALRPFAQQLGRLASRFEPDQARALIAQYLPPLEEVP